MQEMSLSGDDLIFVGERETEVRDKFSELWMVEYMLFFLYDSNFCKRDGVAPLCIVCIHYNNAIQVQ